MSTLEEREKNAKKRLKENGHKERLEQRQEKNAQKKKENHICFIIGEMVVKHFPDFLEIEPGKKDENEIRFRPLEEFLLKLETDPEFCRRVRECVTSDYDAILH